MKWIAIAATVENIIIAAHDDIVLLEMAAENDFDVIVKVYGMSDNEYMSLKNGDRSWRIRFNNLRSTYLESWQQSQREVQLSQIYNRRLHALQSMRGRFEHALNKHRTFLTQQDVIYESKAAEIRDMITNGRSSVYYTSGFVVDYALEANLDIETAISLIWVKYTGWKDHLQKIERLRIRHFNAVKMAVTEQEFADAAAALDKDFFINMLL